MTAQGLVSGIMRRPAVRVLARDVAHGLWSLSRSLDTSRATLLAVSELVRRRGGDRPDIPDENPLTPFELRAFSQNGEDGVLLEMLRRAGEGGQFFIEVGAGAGHENNCCLLADVFGWSGLFVEGDPGRAERLAGKYSGSPDVITRQTFVTPEQITALLEESGIPKEPDVLSIDVDGADYWIWRELLDRFRPRLIVIEYNASLGPTRSLVQPRDRRDPYGKTAYGGASIAALRTLGVAKGYRLIHTEMTGNNAFFVRDDQPGIYPSADTVPLRGPNHFLAAEAHAPDRLDRPYEAPPATHP